MAETLEVGLPELRDKYAVNAKSSVISCCEECLERTKKYVVLLYDDTHPLYCPGCGKTRWQAFHGETKYDVALIGRK